MSNTKLNVIIFGDPIIPNLKNVKQDFFISPFDQIMFSNSAREKRFKMIDNYYLFDEEVNKTYNFAIINVNPELRDNQEIKQYVEKYTKPFQHDSQNPCALHILIYYGGNTNNLTAEQNNNFVTKQDSLQSIIDYHIERDSQYRQVIQDLKSKNLISSKPQTPIIDKTDAKMVLASKVSSNIIKQSEEEKSENITILNQIDLNTYVADNITPKFFDLDWIEKIMENNKQLKDSSLVQLFKNYFDTAIEDLNLDLETTIKMLAQKRKEWINLKLKIPVVFVWLEKKLSLIREKKDLAAIMNDYKSNFDEFTTKLTITNEVTKFKHFMDSDFIEKQYGAFLELFSQLYKQINDTPYVIEEQEKEKKASDFF